MTLPSFWEEGIRPYLPLKCREVLAQVVTFLASERKALALTSKQVATMVALAAER